MSSGILLGVTIIVSVIVAYLAYKNHWKIADYF
jgi:hypothetical protein